MLSTEGTSAVLLIVVLLCSAVGALHYPTMLEEDQPLHFDDDSTLAEGVMSCYYCINVTSNDICNQFAIENPCTTEDENVCYTHHVMDDRGVTVSVTKKCSTERQCQVGCRRDKSANQTVCISCCDDEAYCNDQVATNRTDAVFRRSSGIAAFSSANRPFSLLLLLLQLLLVGFL